MSGVAPPMSAADRIKANAGAFAMAFGHAMLSWNSAEANIRDMLAALARGGPAPIGPQGDILTRELGSRNLSFALEAFAHDVLSGEHADRVRHAARLFNALLNYRNYYVHGLRVLIDESRPLGIVQGITAKSKTAYHTEVISVADLEIFEGHANELASFALGINHALHWVAGEPPPLPDKPSLPERSAKRARTWKELTRLHRSSEG